MPLSFSDRIAPSIALTFDDILIVPGASSVLPHQADLRTRFTKEIPLNIPLVSAGMEHVTEDCMAIVMAQLGGIGVIHRSMGIGKQAEKVRKVKRYQARIIRNLLTVNPETSLAEVMDMQARYGISGIPVVDPNSKALVGMISASDIKTDADVSQDVGSIMIKDNLITISNDKDIEAIYALMKEKNVHHVIIVDKNNHCTGMVTHADKDKVAKFPQATVDENGSLRVAAAVGVGEEHFDRVSALIDEGVDAIVVDDPHGHHKAAIDMVTFIRRQRSRHVEVIAGNIATSEGALALIDAGASAVKVGVGVGSTSTPRLVAGVGVPQLTALMDITETCFMRDIPVIAGSGIRGSADLAKSLATGASSAMLGTLLLGAKETPGSKEDVQSIEKIISELLNGVRLAMSYTGCPDLKEFGTQTRFIRIDSQSK